MRYVLLLLTLLTAGFSVWYYQNRISPEGKELAAQKTTLEQEAAILEKAVIQSRKKLDDAQDATRAAEEDIERFKQAYLQQKRQQHQEIQDAAYQKSVADQQEEVKEHDQKIDRLRRRMKRQRESTKSAREELLRKKEGMRTQLDRLTDQQRSIQAELEQARLDVSTEQAEALKAIKKTYSSVSKSGKESELVLRVPQRRAVNARLNAAEAYVAEAEQALRDTVLEAPYTCQVVECSVGAGARVVAGQPVGKVIPLQERMIRIPVPLEEFSALPRDEQGKVNTALTASCVLNNGKRLQWLGRVTAVDAALDSKSNSAVLIASLEPNASHVSEWQVAPVNMALQVAINVQVPVSAWIPASAVRDGSSIQVKTPSGMQERKVQVVALKDGRALVTVPEFQSGDALIL